jgi:AbrB family looped-hinge helix DNA binding protein
MTSCTLSPKYQVVIPRDVREALDLKPGMKIQVLRYADRIELIPVRPLRELRGFLKGLDPTFERDEEDRA